jgi:molybdopterin converting factor small subunit
MPLTVQVVFYGEARDIAGARDIMIPLKHPGTTIIEFFHVLNEITKSKLLGKVLVRNANSTEIILAKGYKIMVNKKIMETQETISIILKEGDGIGILPPFSGG